MLRAPRPSLTLPQASSQPVAASVGTPLAGAGSSVGAGGPVLEPKEYKKEELPEKSIKSFKDVLGCDEAKEELKEVRGGRGPRWWGGGGCA